MEIRTNKTYKLDKKEYSFDSPYDDDTPFLNVSDIIDGYLHHTNKHHMSCNNSKEMINLNKEYIIINNIDLLNQLNDLRKVHINVAVRFSIKDEYTYKACKLLYFMTLEENDKYIDTNVYKYQGKCTINDNTDTIYNIYILMNYQCDNCTDCYGCYKCDDCTECYGCERCYYCRNCRNCDNCDGCSTCDNCDGCIYCGNCYTCDRCISCHGMCTETCLKDVG